jgi:hypothetical protein
MADIKAASMVGAQHANLVRLARYLKVEYRGLNTWDLACAIDRKLKRMPRTKRSTPRTKRSKTAPKNRKMRMSR